MEITVREDPVSETWTFTLHGHQVEIERSHGFVKIDGQVYEVEAVKGLEDVEELRGQPLKVIDRLVSRYEEDLQPPGAAPRHAHPKPRNKPRPVTPADEPAPRQTQPKKAGKSRLAKPSKATRKAEARTPSVPQESLAGAEIRSTKQAAKYLGLSPKTLETMRTRGGGPPYAKLGRRVVYRQADLDQWLEERLRKSTSDAGPGVDS